MRSSRPGWGNPALADGAVSILDQPFQNDYSQSMGRPRQFEESNAVDAATEVFRHQGYTSTSIDHLVEATGVHRGSLYSAFGSKLGLFSRALAAASAPHADQAVRLDMTLVGLLELAPTDPRAREQIAQLIDAHAITEEQLGARLLARAGLQKDRN